MRGRGRRGRSTRRCSRRRSLTVERAAPRGCCWRRWLLSRTTSASWRISRPSSCVALRGWRTGATGARAKHCSRQASWSCSAVSAGAETQTDGRSRTLGCSPASPAGPPPVVVCHPRRAHDRWSLQSPCASPRRATSRRPASISGRSPRPERAVERAAKTPAKTPAPIARAGKEPQNQRTKEHPPNPPEGGRSENSITIEQTYTTGRGRRRSRRVNVNLDEVRRTLGVPGPFDHAEWERIRKLLVEAVGESTFAIWLEPVELIAIDPDGALVLHAPLELRGWLQERFGRVVAQAAERAGRATRMADVAQSAAMGAR
jgi:hypothetical protein